MAVKNVFVLTMCALGIQTALGDTPEKQDARPAIVPRPAEMEVGPGTYPVTTSASILVGIGADDVHAIAEYLAAMLEERLGQRLDVRAVSPPGNFVGNITLTLTGDDSSLGEEGYELTVDPRSVTLGAPQSVGLFRGVQTMRQLLSVTADKLEPPGAGEQAILHIPSVHIKDQPRYRWRGMLLDCGRHFMDKEFVKRYIDLLAYHKMNVLHWHLTEDQGWRIEIKKCPKLTEIGAWRKATRESEQPRDDQGRYGGFHTQDDVREIVAYAKSRYVTIVPEIEMPGHSGAALASYPELGCVGEGYKVATRWGVHSDVYCAGNDKVFEFLQDVLSEVIELFPSEYIHIGGDECPKACWEKCPKCQARIKAEGLEDEHELQSYFIRRIEKFLNSKGRRLIGWDEILEGGLAPNATVQSWRGMAGAVAAATAGHDVISSPTSHCYLDYAQVRMPGEPTWMGYIPLGRCYAFEPTPEQLTPEQARHVLGLEGNMWTEHAPQERVDWQVFPRLCALAEVGWSPKERRDWDDFCKRMKTHRRRLDALGVTYYLFSPQCITQERVFTDSIEVVLDNPLDRGEIHYTLDGSEPTPGSPKYDEPHRLTDTTTVRARTFLDSGRASGVGEFRFRKLHPHEAVDVPDAVPGLAYAYYEGSWQRLPGFDQLTPVASGTTKTLSLAVRKRDDRFALKFTGYLEVPADGFYTFYLVSDDGSRLWIGSDLVVDHDGLHAASEKSGQVILKAGKHPITVAFFQAGGAQRLEVSCEGPAITKQTIPASALFRSESTRSGRSNMRKPFTDPATAALRFAAAEAARLESMTVGPEHILLGIIATPSDFGHHILMTLGIDIGRLRSMLEALPGRTGPREAAPKPPTPSPGYEGVLRRAQAEIGCEYVGTEHLLIGVILEADGPLAEEISALGLDAEVVRSKLRELMRQQEALTPSCEKCGAPASVHITEVWAGTEPSAVHARHLCNRCAKWEEEGQK